MCFDGIWETFLFTFLQPKWSHRCMCSRCDPELLLFLEMSFHKNFSWEPERHTASYFAPQNCTIPSKQPWAVLPPWPSGWYAYVCFTSHLSCMTVLLSCIFGFSVTCIVTFWVPPFSPLGFFNRIILFLFFLLLLSILFLCNLGVLLVRVGFNCNSFSHNDTQSYYKLLTWWMSIADLCI